MFDRNNLSFKNQREALAQAATSPAIDSTFGQAMQSAQSLIQGASSFGSSGARDTGLTPEILTALKQGPNGEMQQTIDGLKGDISALGESQYSGGNFAPKDDIGRLILETANDLQMDPVDLATAISYETAGTFDPVKAGPTTQWGQHKGFIQFGEIQAQENGVDWNDPVNSQLGAGKAVSKYFRSRGWKPGMSGMDLYSIINAGAPGRYNASDANNGGAPGTVQDKWLNQMAPHRKKAMAYLGL